MRVGLRRLNETVQAPAYQTAGSVGFDLSTIDTVRIEPGELALVRTGLVIATPSGWALLICLRSSTPSRYKVIQPHGIGVIDQDYRGPEDEVRLQLLNYSRTAVEIPASTRIAQGLFVRTEQAVWQPYELGDRSRGGFGSSDTPS